MKIAYTERFEDQEVCEILSVLLPATSHNSFINNISRKKM